MAKTYLTILSLVYTVVGYAQPRILVKAATGLHPLSYASVLNLTQQRMQFADENGLVQAGFQPNDSILISYAGYQQLRAVVSTDTILTFILKRIGGQLDSVRVTACKNPERRKQSNIENDTSTRKFGGVIWYRSDLNAKVGVFVKPNFANTRLHAFSFWTKRCLGAPQSSVQAPLLFSFYSVDESSMLPGELLSTQQIVYHPKKAGKQTVIVDSLYLQIPATGMYIGVEYVMDDKYQWPTRYINAEQGVDSMVMQYGAALDGVFAKDFNLAFYTYQSNTWKFPFTRGKSSLTEVHGTIKFEVELLSCKNRSVQLPSSQ